MSPLIRHAQRVVKTHGDVADGAAAGIGHFATGPAHNNSSQQLLKLFETHASITHNRSHGIGVHGIVTGHHHMNRTFGHEDVFALAVNAEACLFQRLHGAKMVDARKLWHITRQSLPVRGFRNKIPARRRVQGSLEWHLGYFPMPPPSLLLGNDSPVIRDN